MRETRVRSMNTDQRRVHKEFNPKMFLVGVTGLSCSGKTHLSQKLKESLGDECLYISLDDYYKELSEEERSILYKNEAFINFDTPDAIDFKRLLGDLTHLLNHKKTELPQFDLGKCVITKTVTVNPEHYKYIILEGVFMFNDETLKNLCNLKIWVETSEYICGLRRFIKWTKHIEGYTTDYVYNQCVKFVVPGRVLIQVINVT